MTDNQQSPVTPTAKEREVANSFGAAWNVNAAMTYGIANLLAHHRHRLTTTGPDVGRLREALARIVDWHGERGSDDQLLPAEAQPEWIAEAMHAIEGGRSFDENAQEMAVSVVMQGGRKLGDDAAALEPRTADGGEMDRREMAQAIADRLYPSGDKAANSRNYIAYNAALAALRSHAEGME